MKIWGFESNLKWIEVMWVGVIYWVIISGINVHELAKDYT